MGRVIPWKKSWMWSKDLEQFFESKCSGLVLHICCGESELGDVRVDLREDSKANVIADMFHLPFRDEAFDTIICDPPYKLAYDKRLKFLFPTLDKLKAGGKLILKLNWIPRFGDKAKLTEMYLYEGKRYWADISIITVWVKVQTSLKGF